ncbi:MAG: prepilin peptidase [Gammaproteobacteria bacterium]|nr:prepilin peptidase [Gammaproteobacteria bacterium]
MLADLPLPLPALLTAALLFGLLVGSFLNVVIYRLPVQLQRAWQREALAWNDEPATGPVAHDAAEHWPAIPDAFAPLSPPATETFNLVVPRSRCPVCATPISARDNIPVLSWLLLRGRCRHCAAPIALRYPLLELGTGLLTVAVVAQFGPTFQGLMALLLTWALIALAGIDLDHQLLPDVITLPLLWLGLLVNLGGVFTDLPSAVVGAAAGYLVLWSVYWLFRLATGREGMGYGDFKLLAALCAWLGWQQLPLILLIASLTGALYGTTALLLKRQARQTPFAFGPFLALAGGLALMWGNALSGWYGMLG